MGAGDVWAAALPVAAALLALALWRLVWRPRAVARALARQGIQGPPYRFLAGSMLQAKRLAATSRRRTPPLDVASHDIMPLLLPAFQGWVADYVTAEATEQMTKRWRDQILQRGGVHESTEVLVDRSISHLTTEIIGRVAFGTTHREADEVLLLLHEIQTMGVEAMLDAPILW
ncbi:hypothetical protein HU200_023318 [Digitaria exilis]|uniref:Cytochrome P450 n=1 Tax=Digitaria exilis TaxID=1010633 RepID=A0A835EYC3_9POAL|nr:hypothetical protein HU200_023318 [Digitaria exilis]